MKKVFAAYRLPPVTFEVDSDTNVYYTVSIIHSVNRMDWYGRMDGLYPYERNAMTYADFLVIEFNFLMIDLGIVAGIIAVVVILLGAYNDRNRNEDS